MPRGLALVVVVLLLVGLTIGGLGVVRLVATDRGASGGGSTIAVGAPAYAALFTMWGPLPGRDWLMAGGLAALVGGVGSLGLALRSARGPRSPVRTSVASAGRGAGRWPGAVPVVTLLLGIVLLTVGLTQIPRTTRSLMGQLEQLPAPLDLDQVPTDPIDVRGRGGAEAGALLVATAGLLLLFGAGARPVRAPHEGP